MMAPVARTLYLLRHAKSSWDDPGLADHERPLAPRGRRDAKRVAAHLRTLGIEPELVLCSSSARTRETLEYLLPALGGSTVLYEDGIYGASRDELLARARGVPDEVESLMLIGHNPGMEDLAIALASSGDGLERVREKFPTAALATLTLATSWSGLAPGEAVLESYVVPKQLG
jgi:phosphohistidine phosphatase